MCYLLPAFQAVFAIDLEYFCWVHLTLYALVALGLCNFFHFFDSFIENLHIGRVEFIISFAIFICFFDEVLRALPHNQP